MMENGAATAMAIAGRSLRLCDACGRERGRWYCEADQATLCNRCDESVHGANSVSLRHERVPLGPAGVLMKRARVGDEVCEGIEWKKPRSTCPGKKKGSEDFSALMASVKDEVDSFFVHTPDEEESARQVPVFEPEFSGVEDEDLMGFAAVPCCGEADDDENDAVVDEKEMLQVDESSAGDDESLQVPGSSTRTAAAAPEEEQLCFISMEDLLDSSPKSQTSTPASDQEDSLAMSPEVDREDEADELNRIVDEMFSVKEEEEEETPADAQKTMIKLKLDYEDVVNAWSDRGPFWTEGPRPQTVPDDTWFDPQRTLDHGMATGFCPDVIGSQAEVPVVQLNGDERIDSGGGREARVMRYKEKRRNRLFSKTIRYEVRKLNAEKRPRLKGRFVKRAI